MDTTSDPYLNKLVGLAAQICQAPIAMVNLLDEHSLYVKAKVGCAISTASRNTTFCAHVVQQDDLLIVPDAALDDRFKDNPFVTGDPHLRFYAGAPVLSRGQKCFAAVCVIDFVPRDLDRTQRMNLRQMAMLVATRLQTHPLAA